MFVYNNHIQNVKIYLLKNRFFSASQLQRSLELVKINAESDRRRLSLTVKMHGNRE